MLRHIFLVLLVVAIAFIGYDIVRMAAAQRALQEVPAGYSIGPADADLDVTEFLDYSCKYCKEVHPTIMEAIERDGKVRYIPRPLPSENAESAYAARLVYAAAEQGKFLQMHTALMENFRAVDDTILTDLALQTGTEPEKLKADSELSSVKNVIELNGELFGRMGGTATPTFIIGRRTLYVPEGRMPDVTDFIKMFNEARVMEE